MWSIVDLLVPGYSKRKQKREAVVKELKSATVEADIQRTEAVDAHLKTAKSSRKQARKINEFASMLEELANDMERKGRRRHEKTDTRSS